MLRIMIDTNIVDRLLADPATTGRIQSLTERGLVAVVYTHVQRDEVEAVPDPARRDALHGVLQRVGTLVATTVFAVGISRVGEAELGDEETGATYDGIRNGTAKHAHDALIATTAKMRCDVLVTEESRLRARAAAHGLKAEPYAGLVAILADL